MAVPFYVPLLFEAHRQAASLSSLLHREMFEYLRGFADPSYGGIDDDTVFFPTILLIVNADKPLNPRS